MAEDAQGRLWAGTLHGLGRITQSPMPGRPLFDRVFGIKDGLPGERINALYRASDGKLLIGTTGGLAELTSTEGGTGKPFRSYARANGLSDVILFDVTEERDHNLWVASQSGGAMEITPSGFTTYSTADGFAKLRV